MRLSPVRAASLALAACALVALSACRQVVDPCSGPPPPLPNIIMPASLSLHPGERGRIVAVLYRGSPACVGPSTMVWSSSDSAIVRIEVPTGDTTTVLGLAVGSAVVTAKIREDPNVNAAAQVTVSTSPSAQRAQETEEGTR